MKTVCRRCKKEFKQCYRKRKSCRNCLDKLKKYRNDRDTGTRVYYVYYLPEENYCGITRDPDTRFYRHHKFGGKNIEGARILFASEDIKEAAYTEALYQSVLGMEGLHINKHYT